MKRFKPKYERAADDNYWWDEYGCSHRMNTFPSRPRRIWNLAVDAVAHVVASAVPKAVRMAIEDAWMLREHRALRGEAHYKPRTRNEVERAERLRPAVAARRKVRELKYGDDDEAQAERINWNERVAKAAREDAKRAESVQKVAPILGTKNSGQPGVH